MTNVGDHSPTARVARPQPREGQEALQLGVGETLDLDLVEEVQVIPALDPLQSGRDGEGARSRRGSLAWSAGPLPGTRRSFRRRRRDR
jgi:hypothetical protein